MEESTAWSLMQQSEEKHHRLRRRTTQRTASSFLISLEARERAEGRLEEARERAVSPKV